MDGDLDQIETKMMAIDARDEARGATDIILAATKKSP
jgi:hypothetical protein